MEDEELEELYQDLLENGFVNNEYKEKFEKLINGYRSNVSNLEDYAEIDVTDWCNPIY